MFRPPAQAADPLPSAKPFLPPGLGLMGPQPAPPPGRPGLRQGRHRRRQFKARFTRTALLHVASSQAPAKPHLRDSLRLDNERKRIPGF